VSEAVDPRSALAAIHELAELVIERRRRPLTPEAKQRLDALDGRVRDAVDGARAAPRRVTTQPEPAATPGPRAPAARVMGLSVVEEAVKLSDADRRKVKRELKLSDIPKSGYTPPSSPAFLSDYYFDDLVPATRLGGAAPVSVITAEGEAPELTDEARRLLGVQPGRPVAPAAPSRPPAPSISSVAPAPPASPSRPAARPAPRRTAGSPETPVIIHLLSGTTVRGNVDQFDPGSGTIVLLGSQEGAPEQAVEVRDVLAVFLGLGRDGRPTPASGPGVVVQLANDRQIAGYTPDYVEGGAALTVIPEPRRPNLDRVWIPAWAVKAIDLAEG
jgi:hypothetical protein